MSGTDLPLSERLRPTEPRHLFAPPMNVLQLELMLARQRPMNMSFCGPPGHGKTSVVRMIINGVGADAVEIDGTALRTAADVQDKVARPARSMSLSGGMRIVFIDEAGGMPNRVDKALRIVIEQTSENCRFLLCANDSDDISEPIKSRCPVFRLLPWKFEEKETLDRWIPMYLQRLRDHNISFEEGRVIQIIRNRFPDMRAVANQIEMEFEVMAA